MNIDESSGQADSSAMILLLYVLEELSIIMSAAVAMISKKSREEKEKFEINLDH